MVENLKWWPNIQNLSTKVVQIGLRVFIIIICSFKMSIIWQKFIKKGMLWPKIICKTFIFWWKCVFCTNYYVNDLNCVFFIAVGWVYVWVKIADFLKSVQYAHTTLLSTLANIFLNKLRSLVWAFGPDFVAFLNLNISYPHWKSIDFKPNFETVKFIY